MHNINKLVDWYQKIISSIFKVFIEYKLVITWPNYSVFLSKIELKNIYNLKLRWEGQISNHQTRWDQKERISEIKSVGSNCRQSSKQRDLNWCKKDNKMKDFMFIKKWKKALKNILMTWKPSILW